jgi:DNA repair exonuclease SbcCD ATPase subunit
MKLLKDAVEKREHARAKLTQSRALLCSNKLQENLARRNMRGMLRFDYNESTLDITLYSRDSLNHDSTRNSNKHGNLVDLRGLSGGEKSIVTISFLLALWSISESPCLFMDEFDVFMDQQNRNGAIELILDATRRNLSAQCVFITPQGVSASIYAAQTHGDRVRVLKMPDPTREADHSETDHENHS